MRWIQPADQTAAALCGRQKARDVLAYRPSTHCLSVRCEEGTILYHTLTGEAVLVSDEEIESCGASAPDGELISRWFFVPETFDERKFADEVMGIARLLHPQADAVTEYTILTTTDCNARCFYCYEMGIKRIPMSVQTAKAAAKHIESACHGKPVTLRWFGGEPLYNREAIDVICDSLAGQGIAFTSSMVSNGYYFDRETVMHARTSWNLRKVQITLDGTEEVYNRTKAYIAPQGSPYRRVMDHIRFLTEAGVHVTIRMNMGLQNAQDLLSLADELADRFQDCEELDVYAALIQSFSGNGREQGSQEQGNREQRGQEKGIKEQEDQEQLMEQYLALRGRLREEGLLRVRTLSSVLRLSRCMADNDRAEAILPDGRIGRCEHFSEDMVTGSLYSDERDEAVTQLWKEPLVVPECDACVLYPVCVRLKKCEWSRNGCTEAYRKIHTLELEDQVLRLYKPV